jgi:hypothetical protein
MSEQGHGDRSERGGREERRRVKRRKDLAPFCSSKILYVRACESGVSHDLCVLIFAFAFPLVGAANSKKEHAFAKMRRKDTKRKLITRSNTNTIKSIHRLKKYK